MRNTIIISLLLAVVLTACEHPPLVQAHEVVELSPIIGAGNHKTIVMYADTLPMYNVHQVGAVITRSSSMDILCEVIITDFTWQMGSSRQKVLAQKYTGPFGTVYIQVVDGKEICQLLQVTGMPAQDGISLMTLSNDSTVTGSAPTGAWIVTSQKDGRFYYSPLPYHWGGGVEYEGYVHNV